MRLCGTGVLLVFTILSLTLGTQAQKTKRTRKPLFKQFTSKSTTEATTITSPLPPDIPLPKITIPTTSTLTTTTSTTTPSTTTPSTTTPSTTTTPTTTTPPYLNDTTDIIRDNIVSYTYDMKKQANIMHLSRFAANQSFYRLTNHSLEEHFSCGYKTISKNSQGRYEKNSINKEIEIPITNGAALPSNTEAIITSCRTSKGKVLQIGPQTFVNLKNQTKRQTSKKKRPNVLMIGFNGMTQTMFSSAFKEINLERWFKLQKFRRIGENYTYNLMALASGYSPSAITNLESTVSVPFIWKQYASQGYVTALGEDISFIRDLSLDFKEQPVDYYLRPFLQGISDSVELRNNTPGIEKLLTSDYVLDYGEKLLKMYVNSSQPFFGLLWTNTSTEKAKENNFVDYFKRFEKLGLFKNTIVILFSDHVCRPFLNIRLPDWFRKKYPTKIRNLAVNNNRLSSSHDMYLILQHILELGKDSPKKLSKIASCPTCKSLFEEIPKNRTCQSASQSENYCECADYMKLSAKDPHQLPLGMLLVESLNQYLDQNKLLDICEEFTLNSVDSVYERKSYYRSRLRSYRVRFLTQPHMASFLATVYYNLIPQTLFNVNVSSFLRLNRYVDQSKCLIDDEKRRFCICRKEKAERSLRKDRKPISNVTLEAKVSAPTRNISVLIDNLLEKVEELEKNSLLGRQLIKEGILSIKKLLATSQAPPS